MIGIDTAAAKPIPLALYIHFPWCVKKCPYCDFNSYQKRGEIPEAAYVDALLRDLDQDLPQVEGRSVCSIFMGGGTPSLFSPESIGRLLSEVDKRMSLVSSMEITLEANPGTVEQTRFQGYRAAGVNRLSIGVQSFSDMQLLSLGRIHGANEAKNAIKAAKKAGFSHINIDLMFGLPHQTLALALEDLKQAIAFEPTHLSWYQLTREPSTLFYRHPPKLPAEEQVEEIYFQGLALLKQQGYKQYEVSAYARPGYECQHNRNYWEFGDYLGIGAGAHGKLTLGDQTPVPPFEKGGLGGILHIRRLSKKKRPKTYLESSIFIETDEWIKPSQLPLEFMMNALRLTHGFTWEIFESRTGLQRDAVLSQLQQAVKQGWIKYDNSRVWPTSAGILFLNSILDLFVD